MKKLCTLCYKNAHREDSAQTTSVHTDLNPRKNICPKGTFSDVAAHMFTNPTPSQPQLQLQAQVT